MTNSSARRSTPRNTLILPLSRLFFQGAFKLLGGIRCTEIRHIPATGPALLCPNHISDLDPAAILVATRRNDLNALAKSDLFDIKVLGTYIRSIGALPVNRDSADRAALRITEEILLAGRLMLIFPEGRCSPSGTMQKVQSGAMLLSLRTGAPIIPIGIRGTNKVLPYANVWPRFAGGGMSVTVGEPIYPQLYQHLPHKLALRQMTHDVSVSLAKLTNQSTHLNS